MTTEYNQLSIAKAIIADSKTSKSLKDYANIIVEYENAKADKNLASRNNDGTKTAIATSFDNYGKTIWHEVRKQKIAKAKTVVEKISKLDAKQAQALQALGVNLADLTALLS